MALSAHRNGKRDIPFPSSLTLRYAGEVSVALKKENIWVPEVNDWGDVTAQVELWWHMLKLGDDLPSPQPSRERDWWPVSGVNGGYWIRDDTADESGGWSR